MKSQASPTKYFRLILSLLQVLCILNRQVLYCNFAVNFEIQFAEISVFFKVVGTPTEETWTGVTQLPNYKPHRLVLHRPRRLATVFPRLNDIPHAESLATQFLQVCGFLP